MSDGPATRDAILDAVRARGGLHKSELRRIVGIGWGNLGHHLQVLERQGLVQLEGRGRLVWVFDAAVPHGERDRLVATRPGVAQRLLAALGMRDRVTVGSLSQELDLSKKVIRRHLGELERAGVVQRRKGHPPSFAPKPPAPPPAEDCPQGKERVPPPARQRF